MNSFDIVVTLGLGFAVVMGFQAGLLRSAATILGYLVAMPIAVWIMSMVAPKMDSFADQPSVQNSVMLFAIFLMSGMALGTLLRLAVNEIIGHEIGWGDRLAGAVLGAGRVFLIAVMMVLIFDELIPAGGQPAFLVGSQLRPVLSRAGQTGVKSLPPEVTAYIDQLKSTHRI
ncbi:MAG: CvpA family protein [Rhodopseudomonas sp.]|uniref:CvpA family protein n=1 Tax=Rhodopseudomonas sp. TaxID=1078 RepID=UPI0017E5A91B|nr:CvpA family protein [Rhodopseudomonas sp.]NVN87820.1 CvpA family protein [Rhodopseudomonas sp.]